MIQKRGENLQIPKMAYLCFDQKVHKMFKDKIKWFNVIDSTNNEAYRNLSTSPHGTVWAARFQTAGRGQKGNKWESAAGENLMFSILLHPAFLPAEKQFVISEIVALSVCDLLESWEIEATIKWPNDVYVGDKKILGVLIEHFLSGTNLSASIVGIGLNLNQTHFRSDAPNPTSVVIETGQERSLEDALDTLLDCLSLRYEQALHGAAREIEEAYCARLYRLHQWKRYLRTSNHTEFEGYITGVDKYGCLKVLLRNGREEVFAFKEIGYVW